ncbi:hypothetical protein [Spirulina major]|uniref:hypothetical protein n=1 Tax=Spirulina major TaxID=270636 RepID=UPI0011148B67|nr:hypothetical protein [Spirulina major]
MRSKPPYSFPWPTFAVTNTSKLIGIQLGQEQGIQIGEERGRVAAQAQIARNLRQTGMSDAQVMTATGLTPEQ